MFETHGHVICLSLFGPAGGGGEEEGGGGLSASLGLTGPR